MSSESREHSQVEEANLELLSNTGLAPSDGLDDIFEITPYTRGSGFSVKRKYPEWLLSSISKDLRQNIFGFISLAVYHPKDRHSSNHSVGFLKVTAGKVPDDEFRMGMVTPLDGIEQHVPRALSEDFYINLKTYQTFDGSSDKDINNSVSLAHRIESIWEQHISSFKPVTSLLLSLQRRLISWYRNRYIIIIFLCEFLVWLVSNETFEPEIQEEEDPNKEMTPFDQVIHSESSKLDSEWISVWLHRTHPFRRLLTDTDEKPTQVKPRVKPDTIDFHGINVHPFSLLWFYILTFCFYIYLYWEYSLGLVDFLNQYWNVILFLAPLIVVLLSRILPGIGNKLINFLLFRHSKLERKGHTTLSLNKFLGIYYYGKSKELDVDFDDYTDT